MIEPHHLVTDELEKLGKRCMRLHPKECATGAGGTVSRKICSGEITAIFVRFKQRKPGEMKAQKFRASVSAVCLWIRQLHSYGGYAIIMGRTGGHWNYSTKVFYLCLNIICAILEHKLTRIATSQVVCAIVHSRLNQLNGIHAVESHMNNTINGTGCTVPVLMKEILEIGFSVLFHLQLSS